MTQTTPSGQPLNVVAPNPMALAGSAQGTMVLPNWDYQSLTDLLDLEVVGTGRYRNRLADANAHDRAYGGQLLALSMVAAARTVPSDRPATALQFMFLRGAVSNQPIELEVTTLQDGKRFNARHVRGQQSGGRIVLDAQVSFGLELPSPSHELAPQPLTVLQEQPETLPSLGDLPGHWGDQLSALTGYQFHVKDVLDFRLPEVTPGLRLDERAPRFRFWAKMRQHLPDDPHLHAAAMAYLSDWWVNYPTVGGHLPTLQSTQRGLYIASLNHGMWLHQSFRADDWLHFDCQSPTSGSGRGLCMAKVHNRQGRLVASVTQECLMVAQT